MWTSRCLESIMPVRQKLQAIRLISSTFLVKRVVTFAFLPEVERSSACLERLRLQLLITSGPFCLFILVYSGGIINTGPFRQSRKLVEFSTRLQKVMVVSEKLKIETNQGHEIPLDDFRFSVTLSGDKVVSQGYQPYFFNRPIEKPCWPCTCS